MIVNNLFLWKPKESMNIVIFYFENKTQVMTVTKDP